MKTIVATLVVFQPGISTVSGVKGEVRPVEDHWKFDTKEQYEFWKNEVVSKHKKVETTEKDFEVNYYRNHYRMEFTKETWDYYSEVDQNTSKSGKVYINNSPSLSTLRAHKMKLKDWKLNPKVSMKGHEKNLELVNPRELARFILYVEDVVADILGGQVKPSDYKLEILESINH